MGKRLFVSLLLATIVLPVLAKPKHRTYYEKDYQKAWCNAKGGVQERILKDKARVDCVLEDYAVEFDFANK